MDGWEDWPDDFDDSEIQENELNSFNPVRYMYSSFNICKLSQTQRNGVDRE